MSSAEYSCKLYQTYICIQANSVDPDQTAPKEQSDLGPHCLQKWLLKSQADEKADDNSYTKLHYTESFIISWLKWETTQNDPKGLMCRVVKPQHNQYTKRNYCEAASDQAGSKRNYPMTQKNVLRFSQAWELPILSLILWAFEASWSRNLAGYSVILCNVPCFIT